MIKAPPTILYEFGEFRLDPANHVLSRRDGTPVPLTPRAFDTLLFMVEHHGTVLDKERLMEAVWPDSIVEENNLSQHISTLRRLFGDTPGSHRFIVTVPGRGYRFAADVSIVSPALEGDEAVAEAEEQGAKGPVASRQQQPAGAAAGAPDTALQPRVIPAHRAVLPLSIAALLILLIMGVWLFRHRISQSALPQKSIAVLPFENLSSDAENVYFSAGVQDEILSDLAKIAELKVISRTSANLYKSGSPRNVRDIGRQLGVAYLLEGSVQRAGNRVRVNAQLVDTRSDAHVWAQSYDRDLADLFAIQSEIAQTIASQLQATISPTEKTRIEARPTDKPEAYLAYLKAVERTGSATSKQDAIAADELYAQSIQLDPAFALAYARASMLNSLMYELGREPDRKSKARTLAEEARRLGPQLPEAHLASGVYWYRTEKNYAAARSEFVAAGTSVENDPEILELSGNILQHEGHWQEAMSSFNRAQVLDPRHAHYSVGSTQMLVRDWTAAAASYNDAIEREPGRPEGWIGLAYLQVYQNQDPGRGRAILDKLPDRMKTVYDVMEARWDLALLDRDFAAAQQLAPVFPAEEFPVHQPANYYTGFVAVARGDAPSARALLERVLSTYETAARDNANVSVFHDLLGRVYAGIGRKEDAIREAELAVELCPQSKDAVEGAHRLAGLAMVCAWTGEPDRAVSLIERLLTTPAANGITLAELRLGWQWDPLRSNTRFQAVLRGPERTTLYK